LSFHSAIKKENKRNNSGLIINLVIVIQLSLLKCDWVFFRKTRFMKIFGLEAEE
jgi:hypothetical protein